MIARSRHLALLLAVAVLAPLLGGAGAASASGPVPAAPAPAPVAPAPVEVPETVTAVVSGFPAQVGAASVGGEAGVVSAPVEAPIPFAMVGLELPVGAEARVRTSLDGRVWGGWLAAEQLVGDDGPDVGSPEGAVAVERFTEPVWVGAARWVQVAVEGAAPGAVSATFLDPLGLGEGAGDGGATVGAAQVEAPEPDAAPAGDAVAAATARPAIVTRAQWGANEAATATVGSATVRYAVIHHTAGGNSYTAAQAPGVVRGIHAYHTGALGWSDIGYNFLVDRYGRVYEGRRGSIERGTVGAHAQGFNTGSVGVSVLGDFSTVAPPAAALAGVADVLAWKFATNGVDPTGGLVLTSGGSNKYANGTRVPMATIIGHRDVGLTACPGLPFHAQLPQLRQMVKDRIGSGPAPVTGAFRDVGSSVHAANIEKLVQAGITVGCAPGVFCPGALVTRAQAVSMLVRATGAPPSSSRPFRDVAAGHTHAADIAAGVRAGFVSGYPDGTFKPERPVTREQLASLVAKAKGMARQPGQFFNDVPWTSVHLANVNALGRAGISNGCGRGAYCPLRTASRAEMASLIARAFL